MGVHQGVKRMSGRMARISRMLMIQPHFAFSVILPDYVAGPLASPSPGAYSTHGWLNQVFSGDTSGPALAVMNPASRFVDVRDVAAIQVAAMLDSSADHRRHFAAPHKFTLDEILGIWRKAFPDRKILDDRNFQDQPIVDVDDQESTDLIKAYLGRGWFSLEETVIANVQDVL
jgi:nucleoside-diphosphate-sugar epimerase